MSTIAPNQKQREALQRFANANGRSWKHKLGLMWANGKDERENDGALLRQVRNELGPEWLHSKRNTIRRQDEQSQQ